MEKSCHNSVFAGEGQNYKHLPALIILFPPSSFPCSFKWQKLFFFLYFCAGAVQSNSCGTAAGFHPKGQHFQGNPGCLLSAVRGGNSSRSSSKSSSRSVELIAAVGSVHSNTLNAVLFSQLRSCHQTPCSSFPGSGERISMEKRENVLFFIKNLKILMILQKRISGAFAIPSDPYRTNTSELWKVPRCGNKPLTESSSFLLLCRTRIPAFPAKKSGWKSSFIGSHLQKSAFSSLLVSPPHFQPDLQSLDQLFHLSVAKFPFFPPSQPHLLTLFH